jgi:hypothetical protein
MPSLISSPASELVSSAPAQLMLELPAPPATAETPLVPVRMVNEYVYCPRLAFLEWVDGGFLAVGPAVSLKPHARKAFIAAYERRLDQDVTHPMFGYRVSMRRLIEVQARLLARHLDGEIKDYPHYLVR